MHCNLRTEKEIHAIRLLMLGQSEIAVEKGGYI
jgi:hypothetical protein